MTNIIKSPNWDLEISTFVGTLSYAEHYMGHIKRDLSQAVPGEPDCGYHAREVVELDYVLDVETAKRLSTDDYTWNAGDTSTRFFSEEAVRAAAILAMDRFAAPGEWLEDYDYAKDEDVILWGEVNEFKSPFKSSRMGYGNPLKDINHYLTDEENQL